MEQINNIADNMNNNRPKLTKKEKKKLIREAKREFRNQFVDQEHYEEAMKVKNPNYVPSHRSRIINEKKQINKNKLNKNGEKIKENDKMEDFDSDHVEYEFKNGLRYVVPYQYTFTSNAKKNWINRLLLDVLVEQFKKYDLQHYLRAITEGLITINGNKIDKDVFIRDHDIIRHTVIRTEPPVTADPIKIVRETDELLVVDKPASIPVHPCGRFRHNSILCILAKEFGQKKLHSIHRLDRLTSGILFFAKTKLKAEEMVNMIKGSKVQKKYLAKVHGSFPEGDVTVDQPIYKRDGQHIQIIDAFAGKSATTLFRKISSNGTTSIIKCTPITGRTHQIRVHLQWLGYPIVNDPIYNSTKNNYDENFTIIHDDNDDVADNSDNMNTSDLQLHICLHAWTYKSLNENDPWEYSTELPDWAKTDA